MWECKSCHSTIFDKSEIEGHQCKTIKFVSDNPDGE